MNASYGCTTPFPKERLLTEHQVLPSCLGFEPRVRHLFPLVWAFFPRVWASFPLEWVSFPYVCGLSLGSKILSFIKDYSAYLRDILKWTPLKVALLDLRLPTLWFAQAVG